MNEKYILIIHIFTILCSIISAQFSVKFYPSCRGDDVVNEGCPNGWFSYMELCYKLVTFPLMTYNDAKANCNNLGTRLIRIGSIDEHNFITTLLGRHSVNRTIRWFTAGKMDPANLGKYLWDGYPMSMKNFKIEIMRLLFPPLPDTSNPGAWNTSLKQVVLGYNQSLWGYSIASDAELMYSICQVSKSQLSQVLTTQRTPDFGQSDMRNIVRGPCILDSPRDVQYVPMVNSVFSVTFTCTVYGLPTPTIQWYFVKSTSSGPVRSLIDPLTYTSGNVSQTGGLLTFVSPNTSFDHPIECQVQNDYGTIISKQVRIIRGQLQLYNKQPRQTKTVLDNQGFTLDCEAPAHSPADSLVYTFYVSRYNDQGIMVAEDVVQADLRPNLFLSTNLGLIGFSIATIKDSGFYKCMIGWKGISSGTTFKSPDIPLVVQASNQIYPPPMIHDLFPNYKPSNPFLGETVVFECFGYGEMKQVPLKYYWTWQGRALPAKAIISDFDRRVTLPSVQFEDEGPYGCKIEASTGKVTAVKEVVLRINAKPAFINRPTNKYADAGSTVNFTCQGSGRPDIDMKWFRNNIDISVWLQANPNPRYNFTNGTTTLITLVISNVQSSDNAMIGCYIANMFGEDMSYAELKTFAFMPNFNKYPVTNFDVIAGSKVIIPCNPEGAPMPTITWLLNGNALSAGNIIVNEFGDQTCSGSVCILPNNNLLIVSIGPGDLGNYTCQATNTYGSASSSGFVNVVPMITAEVYPVGRRVEVQTNVRLPCYAQTSSYIDIDYDWYFEGVRIKFDRYDLDGRRYDPSQYFRPFGRYFGTMVIQNIQFYDEGNYSCIITTPSRTIQYAALIKINGPPGGVGGITISPPLTNNTYVEWTDGRTPINYPIIYYILEVAKEEAVKKWVNLTDGPIYMTNITNITVYSVEPTYLVRRRYTISGLPANTGFRVRVYAANAFGLGEASSQSEVFTTLPKPPAKVPKNVTGGGGKVGTLVVRWEPLLPVDYNGKNFTYQVQYKESKEIEWTIPTNVVIINITENNYTYCQMTVTLPKGKDYLSYDVQVRAINIEGAGPWSAASKIRSACVLPKNAPQDLQASSFNSSALYVTWVPPFMQPTEGEIIGYHIVYWRRQFDCKSTQAIKDRILTSQRLTLYGNNLTNGVIIGLKADCYYCVAVQVLNTAGDGPESSFFDQTTFKLYPQNFPTMVFLNSTGVPHQIRVTWNGVRVNPNEESVDGYRIRYWLSGGPVKTAIDIDVGLKVTGIINDLLYDTRYNLRVFAYSRGGDGKLSNPMEQFMLVPKSRCYTSQTIDAPDVRYVFICSGCLHTFSVIVLLCGLIVVQLLL